VPRKERWAKCNLIKEALSTDVYTGNNRLCPIELVLFDFADIYLGFLDKATRKRF